jgi:DNA polymerase-3 subunit epsilon
MYLFFDTETTGFATGGVQPRVIQLAFLVLDEKYEPIQAFKQLIKPDGWEVPSQRMFMAQGLDEGAAYKKAKFWIDHGYSNEKNKAEGVTIEYAMGEFIKAVRTCKHLAAHNLDYDFPVVASELQRLNLRSENKPHKYCTMKHPNVNARYGKWPKLQDLHKDLFGVGFDGAHDAWNDVVALAVCFIELVNRKIITLNP